MNVDELLQNSNKFLNQTIRVEGCLFIKDGSYGEWRFVTVGVDNHTQAHSILVNHDLDTMKTLFSSVFGMALLHINLLPRKGTLQLDHIVMEGRLTQSDLNDSKELMLTDVSLIKIGIPQHHIIIHIQENITFEHIEIKDTPIVQAQEVLNKRRIFNNKVVRLEGVLRGNAYQKEISYVLSLREATLPDHKIKNGILILRKGILGEGGIIEPREGAGFSYREEVQVIGKIIKINQPQFPLALQDVTKILVKLDDYRILEFDL